MMHHYQLYLQRPALLEDWTEEELLAKIASFPLDTGYKILLALKKGGSEMHNLALHCRDSFLRREDFRKFVQAQDESPVGVLQTVIPQTANFGEDEHAEIGVIDLNPVKTESPMASSSDAQQQDEPLEESHVQLESPEAIEDDAVPNFKPKKQKKKKHKFQMREYSGISSFSIWLLSFQEEDVEKKIRKEAKAAKRRALEESARKSVTSSPEVISEPLADILASQGHLDAAKKMYTQLMMKYPEKSSYFAAKIENLLKNIVL
ncbi:MAG: hypothetical protein LW630_10110 [Saprospiraceae bacterium]|nr:hypothetical protein [Saprospiraceae bacterium]